MNSLTRLAYFGVSFSLRYRQGYRIFPIVSSYLIIQQLRIVTGIKMQSRGKANGSDEHEECGDSVKRSTRSEVRQKETENRDFYLKMKLEDKRKLYKCKKDFKTLDGIPTWEEYYHKHKEHLLKKLRKTRTKTLKQALNCKVSIWKGDITTLEIDAIVNAANSSLLGGSGVDGAIHEAAGRKLMEECRILHGCKTGEAKITGGYKLPAKYVIHTVGPIGEQEHLLENAYKNSLMVMKENKLRSVALPCISTGIYGYDNEKACHVALKVVQKFLEENANSVDRIIFCLFLQKDVDLYEENMQIYFPVEASMLEDKEETSSDVEMKETESTFEAKIESKAGSEGKVKVKASESKGKEKTSSSANKEKSKETTKSQTKGKDTSQAKENTETLKAKDKEETSSDVEMKEIKSTLEAKIESNVASQGEENIKSSESEGKEKTSSSASKEISKETTKSQIKGKDISQANENTETLKAKDKEETSSDVEMKETKSSFEAKVESKAGSKGKEKVKASESKGEEQTKSNANKEKSTETTKSKTKGKDISQAKDNTQTLKAEDHDMETESNKSSDDAQTLLGKTEVSKDENGDKVTHDTKFGKCDPVQTSRM